MEFIGNQEKWNKLVISQNSQFMQSWNWGEFRKKNGIEVFRSRFKDQGLRFKNKSFAVQIEKRKLGFGKSYFYCAGVNPESLIVNRNFIKEINKLAKKENAIFLKFEPLQSLGAKFLDLKNKKILVSDNIQPKNTLVLDIKASKEKLLSSFHYKHRYNIKLAKRKGIKTRKIKDNKGFEDFYKLIQKTDARKETKSFPKKYYKELFSFSELSKERPLTISQLADSEGLQGLEVIFLGAYLRKKMVAGLVLIIWQKRATYLIGASDYNYRNYMAPHLLQWEAIGLAKSLGCEEYDFWGIAKKSNFESEKEFKKHPWAGITRFKQGFGGKEATLAPAFDYVFSSFWYKFYRFAKKIKKIAQ